MKRVLRNLFFSLIVLFVIHPTVMQAYIDPPMSKPKITQFEIMENGKILHDGDRVHIKFRLENSKHKDNIGVPFSCQEGSVLKERFFIYCVYSESDQMYHGESDPLNVKMYEGRYELDGPYELNAMHRLDDAGTPKAEYETVDVSECSGGFIYNNNCYNGIHTPNDDWKIDPGYAFGGVVCKICKTTLSVPETVFDKANITLYKGMSTDLKIIKQGEKDRLNRVTSSNKCVEVSQLSSQFKIKAQEVGTSIVTVKMLSGAEAICEVTVLPHEHKLNDRGYVQSGNYIFICEECGLNVYTKSIPQNIIVRDKMMRIQPRISKVKMSKKSIKVTYKKIKGANGYEVEYSLNKKFKNVKTKAYKKPTTMTIKRLKKGKNYYIRVRAFKIVDGKKYYTRYSFIKKIKAK